MLKKLFAITPEKNQFNEISLTALRVFTGLTMAFSHGWGKVPVQDQFIAGVEALGFPLPVLFAWLAALSELIGGLFLALGLCTRLSAFSVAFTMIIAAFVAHADDPFAKKEMALLFLFISFIFMIRGGSQYSVDKYLKFKK